MRFIIQLAAAAATLGLASTGAAAQSREVPSRAEVHPRCVSEDGKVECRVFSRADMDSVLAKRAALGIQLSPTGTVRDTIGVFVSRVTPKGPAETAGIIEGDRIVSINGVDLRVNAADAGDRYAAGLPSRRLTREVEKLSPGSTVNLRVWSGGRVRDVRVTAGRASDLRDRGAFGYLFDGAPGAMIMGDLPSRSFQLREFPRFRIESLPRMRIEGSPRIYLEEEKEKKKDES